MPLKLAKDLKVGDVLLRDGVSWSVERIERTPGYITATVVELYRRHRPPQRVHKPLVCPVLVA